MWLRRLDHAAIFGLIAGTYTPLCMLALDQVVARRLLIIEWGAAVLGIVRSYRPANPHCVLAAGKGSKRDA